MKTITVLIFITLIVSYKVQSQCDFKLDSKEIKYPDYIDEQGQRVYSIDTTSNLQMITYSRPNEYFSIDDTLFRDHLLFGGNKLELDKMCGLEQSSYTGSYDLITFHKFICSGE